MDEQPSGIDPDDLATTLRVLDELTALPPGHPDIHVVKQATGRMYRRIRKTRRADARRPQQEADAAVLASTATGSAMRIDDETRGIPLVSTAQGASCMARPRAGAGLGGRVGVAQTQGGEAGSGGGVHCPGCTGGRGGGALCEGGV